MYIIIWAISKTLGSRKGHPQIWEGPIAYRVFLTISINFHKPMSAQYIFSIAGVFAVAHIYIYIYTIYTYQEI